jgi:alpha-beta hydrolase superfamily lysophospholipase
MLLVLVCVALVYVVIACAMIAFPPPESLPMLDSIAAPFRTVDFSGVPELKRFTARDGSALAYREYGSGSRVVVLVHGSSGNSLSMHPLAQGLAARGLKVYSLDIRGHGGSGEKGQIGYVGQLENDMDDFCSTVLEGREAVLAGFSLGGGFVLRYAAQGRQDHFSRYVLLSPYMGSKSPSVKPLSNRWAAVSMPRIIGTVMLGPLGGKLFGHLPVITYGVDPSMARQQTAQ